MKDANAHVMALMPQDLLEDETPGAELAAELLELVIDELSRLSGTWKQLNKAQQDTAIQRVRDRVMKATSTACQVIAARGFKTADCKIESLTVKDGAKVALELFTGRHPTMDRVRQAAVLVLTEPERYHNRVWDVKGEEDQAQLELVDQEPEEPTIIDDLALPPRLSDRLERLGIHLPGDHELWSTISAEALSDIHDYVEARERGEDAKPPGLLGPFLPDDDAPADGSADPDDGPPPLPNDPEDIEP